MRLHFVLLQVYSIFKFAFAVADVRNARPHIVYILADDLGWNDVSFHGSPQIPTPNIDALAASGIVLHNFYMAPQCTPSRASLMTGKYPFNTGLQHFVIRMDRPVGLPLNFTILPQHMKNLGYSTHLVGKWHLGHFKKEYTPTYRGFDSFFGCLSGVIDYFDHTHYSLRPDPYQPIWGVDLHYNLDVQMNTRGKYLTELFTEKAMDVINQHNQSEPLFLLVASTAPHVGNTYAPLQALPEDVAQFGHIADPSRRIYAAMVSKLDQSVGRIFQALEQRGMLDNCIIVFSSDNGGKSDGSVSGQASNWPLRGEKMHLWEGGVRVPALIWSPLFQLKKPLVYEHLMHVSDWLPTLYSAAGGDAEDLGEIDGKNIWPHLVDNELSPRKEMVLNIDPIYSMSAIRVSDYKLIKGNFPRRSDFWFNQMVAQLNSSIDEWVWKNPGVVKTILENNDKWLVTTDDEWRDNLSVNCGEHFENESIPCDPIIKPCLFDIKNDPCEYHDLSHRFPHVVDSLEQRLRHFSRSSWPPIDPPPDSNSYPFCHGFAIVSWMDEEHRKNCTGYS